MKHLYAKSVGYKASENDPDKKIWNSLVDFVKANEEKFFTKKMCEKPTPLGVGWIAQNKKCVCRY